MTIDNKFLSVDLLHLLNCFFVFQNYHWKLFFKGRNYCRKENLWEKNIVRKIPHFSQLFLLGVTSTFKVLQLLPIKRCNFRLSLQVFVVLIRYLKTIRNIFCKIVTNILRLSQLFLSTTTSAIKKCKNIFFECKNYLFL